MPSPLNIILATTGAATVLSSLGVIQGAIGGLAAAATSTTAALSGITTALDFGGQLNDLKNRTGETVRDLVVLRRAFDNEGVGASSTAQMIGLLQKSLGGVNEEGGKTDEVFKRLGVSQDGLKNMGALDQVTALTQGFAKIQNPSERAALAMQLFGRNGAQMLQLLGNSSAISNAEREVGRLAVRAGQNAEKFDDVSDRLSLAKLRLQEFWVVAAERAIPALERMAELTAAINPSVGGAMASSAIAIASAFAGAMLVRKLDDAVLRWVAVEGYGKGQLFAARFVAPLTGALARVLPVGLAAVVGAEVLKGIVAGYSEWRGQQLAAADAGFDELKKLQAAATGLRSQGDVGPALQAADAFEKQTAAALEAADGLGKNAQQMRSY